MQTLGWKSLTMFLRVNCLVESPISKSLFSVNTEEARTVSLASVLPALLFILNTHLSTGHLSIEQVALQ